MNVIFIPYFYSKIPERPYLSEDLIKRSLEDFNNYKGFQKHEVDDILRYRIGIILSRKYTLVIIMEIEKEHLNIVTA